MTDEEKEELISRVQDAAYFSCLKQSLSEACAESASCQLDLAPPVSDEEFRRYYEDQVNVVLVDYYIRAFVANSILMSSD